jgi:uncharacterized cupredoxin-like copper-binding protein
MKRLFLRSGFASIAVVLALAGAGPVLAATTVKVSLWDKGADSMVMDDAHMARQGKLDPAFMSTEGMGITVDKATVPAGEVMFDVTNTSKVMVHEMILAPVPAGTTALPWDSAGQVVDEEAAHAMGEVSELQPGGGGKLTMNLTPGTYILFCNVAGHFIDGMWTEITVQ